MAEEIEIKVPDIGGATNVDVIEVLVKVGDAIEKDTPLVTLESDKASMEIPSSAAGIVKALRVKVGDKLSQGDVILLAEGEAKEKSAPKPSEAPSQTEPVKQEAPILQKKNIALEQAPAKASAILAAGPAVRRMARELGVDLQAVLGSARKSRITKEDLQSYVKAQLTNPSGGFTMPSAAPAIDFASFGNIEIKPLNKIKRMTGVNVHRSWVTIPHVTQFDEADITDLEAFRRSLATEYKDIKVTLLAFVCQVLAKALKTFPQFNASLDPKGENLIYKHYYNIGIAVETPNGLVVPVIKDVDSLSISDIAKEMARLSAKAREKGLSLTDMQGGTFTISSLGGIGGTAFTPIVNSPEVAILGLSRAKMTPVYIGDSFKPRLMLPLSLSYDHRVIDGAEAARFTHTIAANLRDIRRILL